MSYTTPELIRQEIRAENPFSESTYPNLDTVNEWITQAESEIDMRTGNSYSQTSVTDKVFDWEGFDNILRTEDVMSSVVLSYNDQAAGETPSWTLKTEDIDYYVYGDVGEVEFVPSKFKPLSGKKRFKLSYTKGSSSVPAVIERLCTLMVSQRVVQSVIQEQAYSNSGGEVQVGTIKVGNPSNFSVEGFKKNNEEIERLFRLVVGDRKFNRISRAY